MSSGSPALLAIQRHLEAIYAVSIAEAVDRFVIGDAELERLVDAGLVAGALRGSHEQVLVLPEEDQVSIAVYLSDAVRAAVVRGGTLQDHCHATEGVSHFLLLVWSARQGTPLRRLDLELQAEVDKASTVLLLDHGATGGRGRRDLMRRLFGSVRLVEHLGPNERDRYMEAHRLAAAYALRLAALLDRGVHALLDELRRFYRLPPEAKRRHALGS